MQPATKSQHVLISGASIAGPALAWWLNSYGFKVTVVEKATELRSGGYRVDVRGAATEVIRRMGLLDEIKKASTAMQGSSLVDKRGKTIMKLDDPNIFGMRQANDVEIMRGDLAKILYEETKDDVEYIFDDSIAGIYQNSEDVIVIFKNADHRNFDLVIGADGLHSNVRNIVFGDEDIFIENLNHYVAIATIPNYFNLDHRELAYQSAGKLVNIYSTHQKDEAKALFMFASEPIKYNHHDIAQQKNILADNFKNAGWEIPKLLHDIHQSPDFYFDSISQVRMDTFSKGRVVLLGDAGYCPSPASGQGTSVALVGAYILAGELAAANGDHYTAFPKYEQQMKGFITKNQQLGVSVLKEMIPKSKMQVWFQNMMLRLLIHSPWKQKVLTSMFQKMQLAVDEAAYAITLQDYTQPQLASVTANTYI